MTSKKEPKTYTVGSTHENTVIADKNQKVHSVENGELTVAFVPTPEALQQNFPDYSDILFVKES